MRQLARDTLRQRRNWRRDSCIWEARAVLSGCSSAGSRLQGVMLLLLLAVADTANLCWLVEAPGSARCRPVALEPTLAHCQPGALGKYAAALLGASPEQPSQFGHTALRVAP